MITQLLDIAAIEAVGQWAYIVALLATAAIGLRVWRVWVRYNLGIARGMLVLCLIFVLYWGYCILRIRTGCVGGDLLIDQWVCSESAWWMRLMMAGATTATAWWMWRR